MDFPNFFTNCKQDHRLEITIKFNLLVWPLFQKIIDFSMHNVLRQSLYQLAVDTSTQQDQVPMVISKHANILQTMVNQLSGTKGLWHGM